MRHLICILLLLASAATLPAENIDLVTLPRRQEVQLTIYNSEDITLVRERRHVSLKKGMNRLQFSWANTLIDPTSVEFRPLEHEDVIELADTVFLGQKPQHLIWNIQSGFEGQVRVEVSYFTSGLTWSMDYVSICNQAEEKMDFTGHVRVYNNSGEQYANAEIRLVVGTINLVERIADLAQRMGIPPPAPASRMEGELLQLGAKAAFDQAEAVEDMRSGAPGIVKEGLSEYFMFTVKGRETIPNGWSKRMEAVDAPHIGFDIVYRMRAHQYGSRPVRFFIWRNDAEHGLGESPLPDGLVRIFRANGQDGLSYLGAERVRYVPIKAEIEINLGTDDLVVHETRKMGTERLNFSFHRGHVNGWEERTRWVDGIRNYRTKPIRFELHRVWNGHVEYSSPMETSLFDYRTAQAEFTVAGRGRVDYPCHIASRHGVNQKQSRIELIEQKQEK